MASLDIKEYSEITKDQVGEARAAGYLIHHEEEWQEYSYDYGEVERECTRDEWFAATPDWVDQYHQNGGMWGYRD